MGGGVEIPTKKCLQLFSRMPVHVYQLSLHLLFVIIVEYRDTGKQFDCWDL